jgi:hypothetical protein
VPAIIVLVWFLLLELLITLGGAHYLAQFSVVQEIAGLIPSDIFLKDGAQRSEYDILLLKIFKIVTVFSLPFKVWAIYVLTTPFWKNPKNFPISPLAIYWDEELTTLQRVRRSIWCFFVFLVFLFIGTGGVYAFAFAHYGSFKHGMMVLNGLLDINLWFWVGFVFSIMASTFFSCLIRIVVDGFSLIISLLISRKAEVYDE